MATLSERLAKQIAELQSERDRIEAAAAANLADVDTKLGALKKAQAVVTKDVEATYATLLALNLVKEI